MSIGAGLGEAGGSELDLWLYKVGVKIAAADAELADNARCEWRRFGEGRRGARLNFGDSFSHALAAMTRESLLNPSNGFSKTDVRAA